MMLFFLKKLNSNRRIILGALFFMVVTASIFWGVIKIMQSSSEALDLKSKDNLTAAAEAEASYNAISPNADGNGVNIQSKNRTDVSVNLPKNLQEPMTIFLSNNRTITIREVNKSNIGAKAISIDAVAENSQNTKVLEAIKKDAIATVHQSADKRKTIFYTYQKSADGLDQEKLKNWILYNSGNGREKEEYKIENAKISLDNNQNIQMFFDDENGQVSSEPDLTIPAPYFLDKEGKRTNLNWEFNPVTQILSVKFNVSPDRYPLAMDPTLQFNVVVLRSTGTFKMQGSVAFSGQCIKAGTIQTYTCAAKPATGTIWNTVSSYSQTWDCYSWSPADDATTEYNTTGDVNSCRYTCATNYTWDGSNCVADTRTYTCAAKPATGTVWNTVSSYSQTWNGSAWSPADSTTEYNVTGSSTSCRYTCATNYTWDGSNCVADSRTYTCAAKPATGTVWNTVSSYSQTWNGSAWSPADSTTEYNVTPSTTSCRYTCATNYQWNGSACVAQANPSSLSLSHSTRNKSFSVSWTAGIGNGGAGGCKLQFYTGSTWTDITSATSVNCDANSSSAAYNLNADGWKASWNGTQIRILRISDGTAMGTFPQTLACATTTGAGSATPTIDEDCNGYWDNTTSYGCNWGCTNPGVAFHLDFYAYNSNCSGSVTSTYNGCHHNEYSYPLGCSRDWWHSNEDTYMYVTGSCCAYGWLSTCYTYY